MGAAEVLHAVAGKLEQKPGCGCAKRQAAMNAVVPGSGDAVKAVASGVAGLLHGAAALVANDWTVPPHAPRGWRILDQCDRAMLFTTGAKFIVWSIVDGQYRNSHSDCCSEQRARGVFSGRCR